MQRLPCKPNQQIRLPAGEAAPEQVHVFALEEIRAVDAALAARRPLLLRGEPGVGKTQLAKAAAVALGRAFVPFTIDGRTEARDLLWHFDAVARLAEAQLQRTLGNTDQDHAAVHAALEITNFIHPRALWWAFDWAGAAIQAERTNTPEPPPLPGCDPARGVIVLIDEIDKAEPDVPNGLLEALGVGSFTPQGLAEPVQAKGIPPLVMITTNEERTLPDAFLRRCLVLNLRLPEAQDELIKHLLRRGRAHFPDASRTILVEAAKLLVADRTKAEEEHWLPLPGQAEYLDLIRAVLELEPGRPRAQKQLLDGIKGFALRKHLGSTG